VVGTNVAFIIMYGIEFVCFGSINEVVEGYSLNCKCYGLERGHVVEAI